VQEQEWQMEAVVRKQNQIVLILAQKQVELLNAKNEQEATNLQAEIDSLQQDLHQKNK